MTKPLLADINLPWDSYLKQEIEAQRIPRYLYKYRAPGTFTERIITDRKLWFANPESFNDPFDGNIRVLTNNSFEEIKTYWEKVPNMTRAEKRHIIQQMAKDPAKRARMVNGAAQDATNETGVSCYAEEPDNILMWSHYASSHTGLCLKFDLLADPSFFFTLIPVNYSSDYPQCNFIRFPNDSVEKLIGTKAKLWEYEKEWRVLKHDAIGSQPFMKQALVEVLFGCKASKEFISKIKQLSRETGLSHLTYKKAQVSHTHFALSFRNLA